MANFFKLLWEKKGNFNKKMAKKSKFRQSSMKQTNKKNVVEWIFSLFRTIYDGGIIHNACLF